MYNNKKPSNKKQRDLGRFVSEALGEDTGLNQSPAKAPYKGGLSKRDLGSLGGSSEALGLDTDGRVQVGKSQKKPFMSSESMTRELKDEKLKRRPGNTGLNTFGG